MSPSAFYLVFALAFCLTLVLTRGAIWVGERYDLVAVPGGRRKHVGRVVRIGGLGLYPAVLVAVLATWRIPRNDVLELTRIVGVLGGGAVIWLVGLADDRWQLPGWAQAAGVTLGALFAMRCQVFVELFNNPFTNTQVKVGWYLMIPLSLLWLAGLSGAANLLDGLDGLAAGVTAIAALVLFIHMLRLGQQTVALLPLALLGCCLGFLPYYIGRPRIFLGGGAYLLGFLLAAMSIVAGAKVATALLVVWVPVMDMLWQPYSRWRRGQPITLGDRGHLHFRLLDMGWSQSRIVLLYYAVTAALGTAALLVSSRLLKLGLLFTVGLLVLLILAVLTRFSGQAPEADN